jgi:hypothetical protein
MESGQQRSNLAKLSESRCRESRTSDEKANLQRDGEYDEHASC